MISILTQLNSLQTVNILNYNNIKTKCLFISSILDNFFLKQQENLSNLLNKPVKVQFLLSKISHRE